MQKVNLNTSVDLNMWSLILKKTPDTRITNLLQTLHKLRNTKIHNLKIDMNSVLQIIS